MAAGVPGDRSAGTETPGPRPWRTGADPDPGEAGRVMRLELARELLEKRGYGDERRSSLKRGRDRAAHPLPVSVYAARDRRAGRAEEAIKLSDQGRRATIPLCCLMRENGLLAPVRARKAPAWGPEPQRPDHDGCAERAMGYGRDAVLHEGGWVVLVLRGGGSLRHRRGGLARGEEGRSVGSARADPPGCTNPHGRLRAQDRSGARPTARLGPSVHRPIPRRAWLGIRSTASYVGEPECNGVAGGR